MPMLNRAVTTSDATIRSPAPSTVSCLPPALAPARPRRHVAKTEFDGQRLGWFNTAVKILRLSMFLALASACAHTSTTTPMTSTATATDSSTPLPRRDDDIAASAGRRASETRLNSLRRCPKIEGKPRLVAIGSSTMASVIGPMMERLLKPKDVYFALWGRASSSLVRPDFFDWPSKMPLIVNKHRPHVFVISLGTNDNQALKLHRGGAIRPEDPRWAVYFAKRVDEMLELAVGPARDRGVVWVGPYAIKGEASRVIGSRINAIIKERIEAFPGPAFYVDAYTATLDVAGKPITTYTPVGTEKVVEARGNDGIHLKTVVVKELLTLPALDLAWDCLGIPKS